MASILDNVRKGLETGGPSMDANLAAPIQTQQLAQATTGKQATGLGGVPQASQMGANLAAQTTQTQQRQLQLQQQQQAAQLGQAAKQQEVQIQQAKQKMSLREIGQKEQAYRRINEIFDKVEENKSRLEQAQYKAQLEQAGFLYRLNNDKYMTRLKIEGRKNRLDSEIQFKQALQQAIFFEERSLLAESMEFRAIMNASDREFKEKTAMLDLDLAMRIADTEIQAANAKAKAEAIGGIVSTGTSAFGKGAAKTLDTHFEKGKTS